MRNRISNAMANKIREYTQESARHFPHFPAVTWAYGGEGCVDEEMSEKHFARSPENTHRFTTLRFPKRVGLVLRMLNFVLVLPWIFLSGGIFRVVTSHGLATSRASTLEQ